MFRVIAVLSALIPAIPANAEDFVPVTELSAFLAAIEGHELRQRLLGVTLVVTSDGLIQGDAAGWPVTGTWTWESGLFCREMDWGGTPIAYNCQLVELRGSDEIRFTVDAGAGDSATFSLR